MKVAVIFPRYKYISGDVPLGICYLASYLRENSDAEIELIDTTFHKDKQVIKDLLLKNKYDIIGISTMSSMIEDTIWIVEFIKKNHPSTFVIVGGPHPTILPDETINNPNVDAICLGEGEITFTEFVNNNGRPEGINGLWYKSGSEIIKNPPRMPIHDLDILPFPAFDLIDINNYLKYWFQLDSVKKGLKGINILATRGCPYTCSYCQPTLHRMFGKVIRKRSAKNVVNELKILKQKYNIDAFNFLDETFVFDKPWVIDVCNKLIEAKLNLFWGCNTRADLVNEEMFTKMYDSGLRKVYMGIESRSQRILDEVYQKRITIKQIKESAAILKKLKFKVQGYFMIGAPTETEKEIWSTIWFAISLPIDEATFSITTPFPGTYLWDKTKEYINKKVSEFDYYKTNVYSGITLPAKKINRLKRIAFLSFYLSPQRLPNTIKSFLTITEFKKSLMKLRRF